MANAIIANAVFANAMPPDCETEIQGVKSELPLVEVARLRAWKRVLWLRAQWANGQAEGEQGMAIPHSEVDRLLAAPEIQAAMEAAFYDQDPEAQNVSRDIERAEARLAQDAAWARLQEVCGLSPQESDLLLLAVAAEIAPPLRRAYGYLNDDVAACWPSPWLASALFEWPEGARIRAGISVDFMDVSDTDRGRSVGMVANRALDCGPGIDPVPDRQRARIENWRCGTARGQTKRAGGRMFLPGTARRGCTVR